MHKRILYGLIFLVGMTCALAITPVHAVGPPVGAEPLDNTGYGLATAKRANCLGCHKWHGGGGPGYGGAAISLRKTTLDRDQLITVIKCGRPGTNMPYFDRKAYKKNDCYGLTFEDFADDENNRPLQGKKYLNDRQVGAVVDFIISDIQGKPITKAYCEKYFGGPTKECDLSGELEEK